jgi:HK97 family phage major capsid protein
MNTIEQLRQRLEELTLASQSIFSAADTDNRELTEDEEGQVEANQAEFERVSKQISLRQRSAEQTTELSGTQGRRADPERPRQNEGNGTGAGGGNGNGTGGVNQAGRGAAGARRVLPEPRRPTDPKNGFRGMGEFLQCVRMATASPQQADARLLIRQDTTSTYSNEGVGAEGGYSVPPDFRAAIMEKIMAPDSILGMCDQLPTASNTITFPTSETEPWNDTTGVQTAWEGEGQLKPQSKIDLSTGAIRLNKITSVVPVTDELLEDAPALDGYIRRKVPEKMDFKVGLAIIQGTGTGMPLGILNSAARVTVAAGAAPSGTIQYPHVVSMYARMYAPSRRNAVWLISPEVEPQLLTMQFMVAPGALPNPPAVPMYMPAGGLNNAPYATLLGRPVVPHDACNQLGAEGDIIFADLSSYLTVIKAGPQIRTDVSIHVFFLQDLTAFRFVMRIGGQPWWSRPIQPRVGSFTRSTFVTLQAR